MFSVRVEGENTGIKFWFQATVFDARISLLEVSNLLQDGISEIQRLQLEECEKTYDGFVREGGNIHNGILEYYITGDANHIMLNHFQQAVDAECSIVADAVEQYLLRCLANRS